MGKSRTCVWQIGRVYTFDNAYYRAYSEENGIVTFVPAIEGYGKKSFKRKQQYR
jgi:hypothetical protein